MKCSRWQTDLCLRGDDATYFERRDVCVAAIRYAARCTLAADVSSGGVWLSLTHIAVFVCVCEQCMRARGATTTFPQCNTKTSSLRRTMYFYFSVLTWEWFSVRSGHKMISPKSIFPTIDVKCEKKERKHKTCDACSDNYMRR